MISRPPSILTPEAVGKLGTLNVYKASTAVKQGIVMLLIAKGGSGKTTTAATMLDSEFCNKGFFADAEGNMHVLAHRNDVEFSPIATWDAAEEVMRGLNAGGHGYDLVVFDNLSEMIDLKRRELFINEDKGQTYDDNASIRQWGIITRGVLGLARAARDVARRDGVNIIFTAWEQQHEKKTWFTTLAANPAVQDRLPGIIPFVGYLEPDDQTQQRIIHFELSKNHPGKWQCAPTEAANTVPRKFAINLKDGPTLGHVVDVIKGGKPWPFK